MSIELNVGNITQQAGSMTSATSGGVGSASDLRVAREMEANGLEVPSLSPSNGGSSGEGSKTFSQLLENSLGQVNEYQHEADRAIKELVAGRTKNIHETMLTIERADTSLKIAMQVRNKILEAYREVMRMQV